MGCVPPQKRQQPAAANVAIPKYPSLKKNESIKSKNSSNSTENHVKGGIEKTSNQSSRGSRKNIQDNSPKKSRVEGSKTIKRVNSNQNQNSFEKRLDQQAMLATTSKDENIRLLKPDEISRIITVHSLDIHSKIKLPGESEKQVAKKKQNPVQREEDINITFNNNNFAMVSQRNHAAGSGHAVSMGKNWREQTLRDELRGMNEQNFRKINIEFMNFN